MDFTLETLTPTRKKIVLTFSAADVDAALDETVADFRKSLALPGFRKGKVPASVIERRFGEDIRSRATRDILNNTAQDILKKENLEPLSALEPDNAEDFVRGAAYSCGLSFDTLPAIEFPPYIGLKIEQPRPVLAEGEPEAVLQQLRENFAVQEDVAESRLPVDGDVVEVDFVGFDETGAPVPGVEGKKFTLQLGKKQALDDFEALVKNTLPGEEKEGPVRFPADYGYAEVAGKTVTMRIRIGALKVRKLPDLDDELAKKTGHENLEKLREAVVENALAAKREDAKRAASRKLVDDLIAQVDFELPKALLDRRVRRLVAQLGSLRHIGKKPEEMATLQQELEEQARKDAEAAVRSEVFLMALAGKEKLQVSDFEVDRAVYALANRSGQDPRQALQTYYRTGLIHEMRDRILADKAVEFVYSKAEVTEVDPPAQEAAAPAEGAAV